MSEENNNGGNFFRGLVTGAVLAGVAVWFLNSTKKGEEVKEQIKEKGEETLGNLKDLVENFEEKGEEFKKQVNRVKEDLEEKFKDVRKEVVEEAKEGLAKVEELEEKGHRAAQKFFTRQGKKLS
jgi:gas vesicle protein